MSAVRLVGRLVARDLRRRPAEDLLILLAITAAATNSKGNSNGKEKTHSLPLLTYSVPGGLRQGPGYAAESPIEARTCGNGGRDVRGYWSHVTSDRSR
jgi:hypothetical protein